MWFCSAQPSERKCIFLAVFFFFFDRPCGFDFFLRHCGVSQVIKMFFQHLLCLWRKFDMLLNLVPQQKSHLSVSNIFSDAKRDRKLINGKWKVLWYAPFEQLFPVRFSIDGLLQNQNQPLFPEIKDICKTIESYDCYLTIELTVKLTTRRQSISQHHCIIQLGAFAHRSVEWKKRQSLENYITNYLPWS